MNKKSIPELQELWLRESRNNEIGLWWFADDVRELLGPEANEEAVRATTPKAIRPLLSSRQLIAVDLDQKGKFRAWEGDIEQQLKRIEDKWRLLYRGPNIGEIVWFIEPD